MEIIRLLNAALATVSTSGDLFSMAKASWILDGTTAQFLYITERAQNAVMLKTTALAGTSQPAVNVQPDYLPVATRGMEAGCIVDTLSWADNNLEDGYEWVQFSATRYFVSGIMNSTQTLSNDPFNATGGGAGIVQSANWNSTYLVGVNPF
jgi:hypothetical protein